jgi:hypothetical protein
MERSKGVKMAINRDVKGMCYSDYEHLLRAEDVLEQLGYSTAHHLLHNVISDVNAEIEMVYFNDPELRKLANTIEEASRDFRRILVELKDGSLWDFAWFGTSMTILVMSGLSENRKAFIWEVQEVIVGGRMEQK